MFGKKKTKSEQPITPEELSQLNDKQTADPTIRKFHVTTDSAQIMALKKRRRILSIIIGGVATMLLILFLVSMLVTKWGDLVIEIDRPAVAKGFTLSESEDFASKSVALSAKQALDVTNITYSWLPKDLDTSKDGEHNGENYVAYTFYMRNDGEYFFFPTNGGTFREGNKDDENVNYISFTVKVTSPDANVDFWFEDTPSISYKDANNVSQMLPQARYSISVNGKSHVYSEDGKANKLAE